MARMWFCPDCGHLLYPKEDRATKTLGVCCKSCTYEGASEAGFEIVYQRQVIKTAENHLAKVKDDVVFDPTLPREKGVTCPNCAHQEAVFMQAPPNRTDERMHLIFVCTDCRHKWQS